MDRESFLETLKQEYADEIREAYAENEHHHGKFDLAGFDRMLARLSSSARRQGLPEHEFDDLVYAICPEQHPRLSYRASRPGQGSLKKAA